MKKMLIKRIIFIILFFMIAVGITTYFIMYNLPKEKKEILVPNEKVSESNEKTLDLNGKYDVNDLKVKKYAGDYRDVKFTYYQIDGLKDTSIQYKINYNLKKDIENLLDKWIDENLLNYDDCTIFPTLQSNFNYI